MRNVKLHKTSISFIANHGGLDMDHESYANLHAFLDTMNLFQHNTRQLRRVKSHKTIFTQPFVNTTDKSNNVISS